MANGSGTSQARETPQVNVAGPIGELVGTFIGQALKLTLRQLTYWVGERGELARKIGDVLHAPFKGPIFEFFQTREGLRVSENFQRWILFPALRERDTTPASIGTPLVLEEQTRDVSLHSRLGDDFVFKNAKAFCLYLVGALEHQWGGKEDGELSTNGLTNLHYVWGLKGKIFEVFVTWSSARRQWEVDARKYIPGSHWWGIGVKCFPAGRTDRKD